MKRQSNESNPPCSLCSMEENGHLKSGIIEGRDLRPGFIGVSALVMNCGRRPGKSDSNYRDRRFGSKVGQIGPKWDKSGTFSDQISVQLARGAKCTEI